MGLLCFPKASRKLQRTLKNLRVSFLCFLLTFLVLRNTIGAGKFGTPAQDFEEIRLHLHNVALHRRHFRVLAEAVEEENPPLLTLEEDKQRSALHGESEVEGGVKRNVLRFDSAGERGKLDEMAPLSETIQQRTAPLPILKEKQGNAALLTLDVKQPNMPSLAVAKDVEGFRFSDWDKQRKLRRAQSKVLLLAGLQSSTCKKSAGEHLLLKSVKNKVDYSTLHGFEFSVSFGGVDPQMSRLSLLQSSMVKYPHVEWLWWVPHEALIITDIAFKLPFHNYTEFNLVLLGSAGSTHPLNRLIIDLNTDTFLIRNCQWSLELLQKTVKKGYLGRFGTDMLTTVTSMIRKPGLGGATHASIYNILSIEERTALSEKVYVEDSAVLRSNRRDLALKFERLQRHSHAGIGDKGPPFVTHLLGCDLCHEALKNGDGMCLKQMERVLLFAEKQIGMQRKSLDSSKHSVM